MCGHKCLISEFLTFKMWSGNVVFGWHGNTCYVFFYWCDFLYDIYSTSQTNVCTDFEINRFKIDEVRKYATIVCFIWRHVTQKRYVVRHGDYDTSDRYFDKEHF